jgi:hypothetical protein
MSDPISRLEVVRREIDRVFGDGYAAPHPDDRASIATLLKFSRSAALLGGMLDRMWSAQRIGGWL